MDRTLDLVPAARADARARSCKSPGHLALVDATSSAYRLEHEVAPRATLAHLAHERTTRTRVVVADMRDSLEQILVEVGVDMALAAPDEASDEVLVQLARMALVDLVSIRDGLDDEGLEPTRAIDRCIAARTCLLDIGLTLEQRLAQRADRGSALTATRRLVQSRRDASAREREILATQLRVLGGMHDSAFATARQVNVCIARSLVDASPGTFDTDEARALRGLCDRVLGLIWESPRPGEREEMARAIVADATALEALLSRAGPLWADVA